MERRRGGSSLVVKQASRFAGSSALNLWGAERGELRVMGGGGSGLVWPFARVIGMWVCRSGRPCNAGPEMRRVGLAQRNKKSAMLRIEQGASVGYDVTSSY